MFFKLKYVGICLCREADCKEKKTVSMFLKTLVCCETPLPPHWNQLKECGFFLHYVGSYFYFVTTACVNFSQPSVPPVTLIYLGARRTGILATEADIPTLFVLPHNVSVCACVFMYIVYAKREHVHVHRHACMLESVCVLTNVGRNVMLECKATPHSRL